MVGKFSDLLVLGLLLLNFIISWWNAYWVGRMWPARHDASTWQRFVLRCTALMSVFGFTWVAMVMYGAIAYKASWLTMGGLEALFNLGLVVIGPGIWLTGVVITIDSVIQAYQSRSAVNAGIAAYDVGATAYNTAQMVEYLPDAWQSMRDFIKPDDDTDVMDIPVMLVVGLFVLALFSGVLLTGTIIKQVASNHVPRH